MANRLGLFFVVLYFLNCSWSQSPNFNWATHYNANSAWPLTIDETGSIYTASVSDVSINKFDNNGNFVWNLAMPSTSWNDAYGLQADKAGHIYVTGQFGDSLDFDPSGFNDIKISNGDYDAFIQKIDTSGNHLWVKTFGGGGYEQGIELALGQQEDIFATGWMIDTVIFELTSGPVEISQSEQQTYCVKVNPDGNFEWVYATEELNGTVSSNDIETDKNDNIFIVGQFTGTVDFEMGPGQVIQTAANGGSSFVIKLDSLGSLQWVKTLEGPGNSYCAAVKTDQNNNIYMAGSYASTVDMNPGSGTENVISEGFLDGYVVKLDESGSFLWQKTIGGISYDHITDIDVDKGGNLYTLGTFRDTVDIDPTPIVDLRGSNGLTDIFWQSFDKSGNYLWGYTVGGVSSESANKIELDHNWSIVTAGRFSDSVDFDPTSGSSNLFSSASQMFLNKFDQCILGNQLTIENGMFMADAVECNYQWIDCNNSDQPILGETNQSFTPLVNGSYAVIVSKNTCIDTSLCTTISDVSINESTELDFVLFPNPSSGTFCLEAIDMAVLQSIEIFDINGTLVYRKEIKSNELFELDLSSGIYFVHGLNGTKSVIKKLVVR